MIILNKESEEKLLEEEEKVLAARKIASDAFEQKLKAIKEENDLEIRKLSQLLETSEIENHEKIEILEEKHQKLQDLEEYAPSTYSLTDNTSRMNRNFEQMIYGLKKTVLEVQERMNKNDRNIDEMQLKLGDRDTVIMSFRQNEAELTAFVKEVYYCILF